MPMPKQEQLAADVERALADFCGASSFIANEWPDLAAAFARLVVASQGHSGPGTRRPYELEEYAGAWAAFADKLAQIAGL